VRLWSILILVLLFLTTIPSITTTQSTSIGLEGYVDVLEVIPANFTELGNASVFINESGTIIVLSVGDLGGIAGVTTTPPLGFAEFNGTISSISDFGFWLVSNVTVPSIYLVMDVILPNGSERLMRGNATVLPTVTTYDTLLSATSDIVKWCIGTWDGIDPRTFNPIEELCGLSYGAAVEALPSDSRVKFVGIYYDAQSKAHADLTATMMLNGQDIYFTLTAASRAAFQGSMVYVHSGNYTYWSRMYKDNDYITYVNNLKIVGEDTHTVIFTNPRIYLGYVDSVSMSNLTIAINDFTAGLEFYDVSNLYIGGIEFYVNTTPTMIMDSSRVYEVRPIYIMNSEGITIDDCNFLLIINTSFKPQAPDTLGSLNLYSIGIIDSQNITISNTLIDIYINNITINDGLHQNIMVIGIDTYSSSMLSVIGSTINVLSKGGFSIDGFLSIDCRGINTMYSDEVMVFSNYINVMTAPEVTLTDGSYMYYAIEGIHVNNGERVNIAYNEIDITRSDFEGASSAAITLSEVNNTVVSNNYILGNVPLSEYTIDDIGIDIVSPTNYDSGQPALSENISICNNTINGFDHGISIDASGEVWVKGELTEVLPDLIVNVTICYNNIMNNGYGIHIIGYDGTVFPGRAHYNNIYGNLYAGLGYYSEYVRELNISLKPPIYNASLNWWGDFTGPKTIEHSGSGDVINDGGLDLVIYSPWLNKPYPEGLPVNGEVASNTFTLEAGGTTTIDGSVTETTDMEAVVSANSDVEITMTFMKYDNNPVGMEPPFNAVKYVDVRINASNIDAVNEVVIRIYYRSSEVPNEASLIPFWWNGSSWVKCSEWDISNADTGDYAGYVWIKVNKTTSPSIYDLTGTEIVLTTSSPAQPIPESPLIPIAALITTVAMLIYLLRRSKSY